MATTLFNRAIQPRRWQGLALDAWRASERRGIAEVVTGGGKTIFAGLCMADTEMACAATRFVILVPTIALLDQWYVSLREDFEVPEIDIAAWTGGKRPKLVPRVNLMVLNTARVAVPELPEIESTFLVVDECHRAGSSVNALILQHPFAASLGISATPDSDFDNRLSQVLEPALGPVIYRYGLDEARADGILSPFDLVNVRFELLQAEKEEYNRWTSRIQRLLRRAGGADVDGEVLQALLRRRAACAAKARLRVPLAVRIAENHRGARTMIFHESVADAEEIRARLAERGHSVTIYHSRISASVRRDNLRLFRKGAFDVLVTCRALDEGVNIPEVQIAVIASATASTRQRVQRLGRVLRPAPGKERAVVYSLYATRPEAERLLKEAGALESAESVTWQEMRVRRG